MTDTLSIHLHPPTVERFGLNHQSAAALVASLLTQPGRVLKSDERSDVRLHHIGPRAWVVKRYGVAGPKLWLYRVTRSSRGWREWRGAMWLNRAGIRCNEPLALVIDRTGGKRVEALVLPYIPGKNTARWLLRNADPLLRRRVAESLGRQIGAMSSARIVNRDHKATNVIVDEGCVAGNATPVVIDPAGLRRRRNDRQVFRAIALLYGTTRKFTPIPDRLALRCLRAALREDPSLCRLRGGRLRAALGHVQAQMLRADFEELPESQRVRALAH